MVVQRPGCTSEFWKLFSHVPRYKFDVWSLSCIGAWVGIVYNQFDGPDKAEQTHQFFKDHVFRDDESYERFPDKYGVWNGLVQQHSRP